MTKRSFRNSLWLVVVTAIALIAVQVYYTIQNYQVNKLQFSNEVQESLDASIEQYFANKAKDNIYVLTGSQSDSIVTRGNKSIRFSTNFNSVDSLLKMAQDTNIQSSSSSFRRLWANSDSLPFDTTIHFSQTGGYTKLEVNNIDSGSLKEFQFLTQKVMVSISEELIDLDALYTTLNELLESKQLDIDFTLRQDINGKVTKVGTLTADNYLTKEASNTYLGKYHNLFIDFENATLIILKDGISELVLSFLLVGLVIGTLLHLYRTIYAQKQLAEIKDDLISNITHEFKTPIATIFSALEGVTSFNKTNDPEKTKRYLALSNSQLHKLNDMVEKMLETATIDQGQLNLNREAIEVGSWTKSIVERFQMVEKSKKIELSAELPTDIVQIDRFHLENAISNLIDNAIKYGGSKIEVTVKRDGNQMVWEVKDNGGNIPKSQREKIFDKLYRIPTGNKHDVKGFGIGLYYARKIAELHEGQLSLEGNDHYTIFRLSI